MYERIKVVREMCQMGMSAKDIDKYVYLVYINNRISFSDLRYLREIVKREAKEEVK